MSGIKSKSLLDLFQCHETACTAKIIQLSLGCLQDCSSDCCLRRSLMISLAAQTNINFNVGSLHGMEQLLRTYILLSLENRKDLVADSKSQITEHIHRYGSKK